MNISYGKQSIDKNDIKYVVNTLKKDFLTQGPLVEQFETQLKLKLNSKYATVVNNGSSALLAVGKILNWAPGDFIAVSPITFLSSVNVVEHCGATPIFIDINLKNYSMDPKALELILQKDKKKRIKAAIITDYGGQPAQWSEFRRLKRKYKIALINDNCHALGSIYKNNYGYAVKYADFVTLSFHPVKAITTGEGGAILTNNLVFDRKAKLFRSHGIERNVKQHWKYKMNILGFNLRLPDLNCALGISQIKKLKKFIKKRQEIAIFYNKLFKNNIKFNIPLNIKNNKNSYHLYPLLMNLKVIKKKKIKLLRSF